MRAADLQRQQAIIGESKNRLQISISLRGVGQEQPPASWSQPEEVNVVYQLIGLLAKQERVKGH